MKYWKFYTTKELKPSGWLKRQLALQAKGLSGNLDLIWPDIRDSAWIGGNAEGWERVPYWLDGFIPLAYLLEDDGLIARAKRYMDAILASQRPDGWICPCRQEDIPGYDTWAVLLISKVLVVYYECSGDERVPGALYRAMRNYHTLLSQNQIHLFSWGQYRWYEGFIAINFLYARYPEDWLRDLARLLREQGTDYAKKTELWNRPLNKWTFDTHIVNLAMMLKSEAVSYQILGEEYTDRAEFFRTLLDRYNGTPVGLFTGDECLSGLSPIQGTELCAVVEQMYSYELLYAATGDPKWAERLEILAFNALPATISDDMWTHQYDQMSNQIACVKFPGRSLFRTNSDDAHLFGLEPNYGCCTANFNQGWPKFALSAFLYTGDTVLSAIPVPSRLKTEACTVELESEYPFRNELVYRVSAKRAFTLQVRIPAFAEALTVDGSTTENTGMLSFPIAAGENREIRISFCAIPRYIDRPHKLKAVQWGSLVFSLPIEYEKVMHEYIKDGVERKFPYCDYEYVGKSQWHYGYCGSALTVEPRQIDEIPFSSEHPPVVLKTNAVRIEWEYEDGFDTVCAKLPTSRVPIGETETVTLYPYGCAKLRMTELPLIE